MLSYVLFVCRKPKTQRVKRDLEKRESKVFENDKMTNFIKGGQTNELVNQTLKELVQEHDISSIICLHIILSSKLFPVTDLGLVALGAPRISRGAEDFKGVPNLLIYVINCNSSNTSNRINNELRIFIKKNMFTGSR